MIEWGHPENFIWLWSLPAVLAAFLLSSVRKRAILSKLGDIQLLEKLIASFDPLMRWVKRALLTAALACLITALAQPHLRTKEIEVERKGVDVIIAIDVSKSMLAKDIAPNRLEKAKLEFTSLVDKLKGDRIGIIAFAGDAFISCPLTLDRNAVKLFLSTVNPNLVPTPGTAIGSAINVAIQAFGKAGEEKALILLTDGEDHASKPEEAARRAKASGIRVFTIGVGTTEGSTLPGGDFESAIKRDLQGNVVLSKLDEKLLKQIAQTTGGAYFRSSRGELELDALVAEIRKMTQKGFKKDKIIQYEENFQYFLWIALALLFIEQLLSERRWFPGRAGRGRLGALALLVAWFPFVTGFGLWAAVKNEEGNGQYKKGRLGKAKSAYAEAQKADPKSPEIAFNLGNAYYKEGSFDKSLAAYAKAVKSQKNTALQSKAFYNLGNNWVRREDKERAIQFYKDALRLNPKDEDAKFNLELLLKQKDQNKDQNKDQKKDQNKDQQKDKQDQGGGGQGQDDKPQDPEQKDQQQDPGGGQGRDEKPQDPEQKDQQQGKGGEGQDRPEDQKPEDQKGDQPGRPDQQPGNEPQDQKPEGQGPGGEGEPKDEEREGPAEPKPKSAAEQRAEQILAALEGQEKQIMKNEAGKPAGRVQRITDKDW